MNEMPKPPRGGDPLPLVGVSACRIIRDSQFPGHWTAERYLHAVADAAGALPIQIPALGATALTDVQLHALLERLDGLLLTGSPSNVEPRHYDGPPSVEGTAHDPDRDATTKPTARKSCT